MADDRSQGASLHEVAGPTALGTHCRITVSPVHGDCRQAFQDEPGFGSGAEVLYYHLEETPLVVEDKPLKGDRVLVHCSRPLTPVSCNGVPAQGRCVIEVLIHLMQWLSCIQQMCDWSLDSCDGFPLQVPGGVQVLFDVMPFLTDPRCVSGLARRVGFPAEVISVTQVSFGVMAFLHQT